MGFVVMVLFMKSSLNVQFGQFECADYAYALGIFKTTYWAL